MYRGVITLVEARLDHTHQPHTIFIQYSTPKTSYPHNVEVFYFYRDLAVRDINSKVDPYAVINYKGKELSTPTLRKTRFPRWNKTYELPINRPLEDFDNRTVRITIYDSEKFHQDAFLGEVSVR